MRNLAFAFLVGILFSLTSCGMNECGGSKDVFLEQYGNFIDEVQEVDYDYSDNQWDTYDRRFKKYVAECYDIHEEALSNREKQQFYGKMAKYYFNRYGVGVIAEIKNENSEIGKEIREQMELIGEDMKSAFSDIEINFDGEEVEGLLKEMGEDIEKVGKKWGKKIEEIIDKKK